MTEAVLDRELLYETLAVWAPEDTYPRRVGQKQTWVRSPLGALNVLEREHGHGPGYISVYGFPRGHPRDGHIPAIDTLFIDLDIPSTGRFGRPDTDDADVEAWQRDMARLIVRVRMVADALLESGYAPFFRASLSGYKGVHLYLDFEPIPETLGDVQKYRNGLAEFARDFVTQLEEVAGIELAEWVDVDSSDLARLTRLPNTLHEKATAAFGEPRYCVPVTLHELSTLTASRYVQLTQQPRRVPAEVQRKVAPDTSELVAMFIAQTTSAAHQQSRRADSMTLSEYTENALDLGVDDLPFVLSDKPCFLAFVQRPDVYDHGDESHQFKLALLTELATRRVPIETVLAFFEQTPDHDPDITLFEFSNVLSYKSWNHETLWLRAPVFCDPSVCKMCAATQPVPT